MLEDVPDDGEEEEPESDRWCDWQARHKGVGLKYVSDVGKEVWSENEKWCDWQKGHKGAEL